MQKTLLVTTVVVFSVANVAWAIGPGPVPVPNHSFEDQGLGDGSSSDLLPVRTSGSPGWETTNGVKVYNPPGDGTPTQYSEPVPDGNHLLYMETYNFLDLKAGAYMELDIQEGWEYTVTVELGGGQTANWGAIGEGVVQGYAIQDLTDPFGGNFDKVIDVAPVTPPLGWTTLSYSFTGEARHAGYDLLVELAESENSPTGYIHWDNLRVDAVPEPVSMTILALSSLGLFLRRR